MSGYILLSNHVTTYLIFNAFVVFNILAEVNSWSPNIILTVKTTAGLFRVLMLGDGNFIPGKDRKYTVTNRFVISECSESSDCDVTKRFQLLTLFSDIEFLSLGVAYQHTLRQKRKIAKNDFLKIMYLTNNMIFKISFIQMGNTRNM